MTEVEVMRIGYCGCCRSGGVKMYPLYSFKECNEGQKPAVWLCSSCWRVFYRTGQYRTLAEHLRMLESLRRKAS